MLKCFVFLIFIFSYENVAAQTAIDKNESIVIGGIKQFITVKTKDSSKPLLLFLHGGPGGSVLGYADKFTNKLQEHFVVVQWDQRETGKTLALNASSQPLTLALFKNDTHALIDSLLRRFKKPKLYLAAHSWGTVLGFYIADQYPELLYAYLPISPVINQLESERIILDIMKVNASKERNADEIKELADIRIPFENGMQLYYHRKWLLHFNHNLSGAKKFTKDFALTWASTWLPVWTEASKLNLNESIPSLKCPVYFFIGRKDYQTNFKICESYYQKLNAPKKEIFWFENTGHSIPAGEPAQLQSIIIQQVLPETYKNDQ
jgi:pimeloyl-ACP methyl ester carboxylesterase